MRHEFDAATWVEPLTKLSLGMKVLVPWPKKALSTLQIETATGEIVEVLTRDRCRVRVKNQSLVVSRFDIGRTKP